MTPEMMEEAMRGTTIIFRALRKRVPMKSQAPTILRPRTVSWAEKCLTRKLTKSAEINAIRICQCNFNFIRYLSWGGGVPYP